MDDYFEVFGLSRKLQLDEEELRRRFYALSRRHHPDFHQQAGEREQAAALASSALVNRAYRALRDPIARVEYLIALEEGRRDEAQAADGPPRGDARGAGGPRGDQAVGARPGGARAPLRRATATRRS